MKRATITSKKDERAAFLQRRRTNHHKALETLARQVGCETNGLTLWRQLRRLENWLSAYSVQHSNGEGGIDGDKWEAIKEQAEVKLAKIFGGLIPGGVFINSDPRGYALKLRRAYRIMATQFEFTITREMIHSQGRAGLTATQRARLLSAIGPLQVRDEYKRVYRQGDSRDWFYQVENDQQRDQRMGVVNDKL